LRYRRDSICSLWWKSWIW